MSGYSRPVTAQEAVLAELRAAILDGRLQPGSHVRQDELARELHVSRVPIREALKILNGEGLLAHEAHRGYFVTRLSFQELSEVYEIREILEAVAVRRTMQAMSANDIADIRQAKERVEAAAHEGRFTEMGAANREFHFALFRPSGMTRLIWHLKLLWDSTDAHRSLYYVGEDHRNLVLDEHDKILEAIEGGDVAELMKWLNVHRQSALGQLKETLTED